MPITIVTIDVGEVSDAVIDGLLVETAHSIRGAVIRCCHAFDYSP